MDILVIRTRLQALIALQLLEEKKMDQGFTLVRLFQHSLNEDDQAVYEAYEPLERQSRKCVDIVSAGGIFLNVLRLLPIMLRIRLSRGTCFLASIDSYPLVILLRALPGIRLVTFDDGSANIRVESKYFAQTPISGPGIKKRLAKAIFPQGAQNWCRNKTSKHYTIFPSQENIVSKKKLIPLVWRWSDFLSNDDLARIPASATKIALGAPFHNMHGAEALQAIAKGLVSHVDLYIAHPRERISGRSDKVVRLKSPAESVLGHLSAKRRLIVYHFSSTVSASFLHCEEITFIDVMPEKKSTVHGK